MSISVDIYSPRDQSKSENLGLYDTVGVHYQSDGRLSSGFSPLDYRFITNTLFRHEYRYTVSFSISDPPSVILVDYLIS